MEILSTPPIQDVMDILGKSADEQLSAMTQPPRGEVFDVALATRAALDEFARQDRIVHPRLSNADPATDPTLHAQQNGSTYLKVRRDAQKAELRARMEDL